MNIIGAYEAKKYAFECANTNYLTVEPHFHPEWECVICLDGAAKVFINDDIIELNKNEMVMVPPYSFHYYDASNGDYIVMCFSEKALPSLKKEIVNERPQKNKICILDNSELYDTVMHMKSFYSLGNSSYSDSNGFMVDTLSIGYINLIMFFAISLFEFTEVDLDDSGLLQRIISYCEENYAQEISLDMLSSSFGFSRTYISHIFNQTMQMSLTTFINWIRISKACDMLRNSLESVTDIAHNVGFGSLRAFNRTFQRLISKTPSEYRKLDERDIT